ncbi:penicillin-binding protein 2 [Marinicauda algicola]|uniref:Penicillin-binding protein 2 n=1 Tax=Marinicauda algicola TaxID=2029849 RepID=A0A4S2GZ67_9PROT|nr:penicillin-binding protein 2 [Marinicauda algicola]TGY88278.1 penicillin-binding protein 2 [Marinicauda algicola]
MKRDKQESQAQFNRRAVLLAGLGGAAFAGLGARLYSLQVHHQDRYRVMAEDNQFNFRLQTPARGRILDRFGEPIADNRESYRIVLIPEQAGDARAALDRLAEFMDLSEERRERILAEIARSPRFQPVEVAEDLDWETFSRVNLFLPDLPGITPDVGEVRTYPYPQAFAHVAGYVQAASEEAAGDDPLLLHPGFRIGRAGVEAAMDERLRGAAGQLKVEVNAYGRVIRELPEQSNPAVRGQDVTLSIDASAQRFGTERLAGESAAAVTLDIASGEILSLVSTPSFDPNLFVTGIAADDFRALNENEYRPLFNKATTGLYAPASTIKGMMALAALEAGVMEPGERVYCRGHTELGNRRFHCWRREGHGSVDLHEGIKTSCDIYFYEVAERLGIERIHAMATRMGLGQLYDIGMHIPARADGLVPTPQWKRARRGQPWTTGDTYNVGIGQGDMLASPLQLAVMTARLASGREVTPTLLRRGATDFASLGLDPEHQERVHRAMRAVVHEPGGTSYWTLQGLGVEGVEMAGKTGTAQVYSITAAERAEGLREQDDLPWRLRNHGLFIGYAPAIDPQYAVAVVVEHGGGGSRAAARPARDMLKDLIERDPAGRLPRVVAAAGTPGEG